MYCTVMGVRHVEYDNREGRHIVGTRIYVSFEEKGTTGLACLDVFLNQDILPPDVGDLIVLRYNRYGRCQGFDFAG